MGGESEQATESAAKEAQQAAKKPSTSRLVSNIDPFQSRGVESISQRDNSQCKFSRSVEIDIWLCNVFCVTGIISFTRYPAYAPNIQS